MRKKRRRSSSARRPNAIQGKARLGQRLARAGHGRIKARHWHRRQCSGAQPMRYQRLPLAVIQHSRPACSKRNSLERLLALALGVKMVVCLGPLLVLASVIVIACYSAATNDVLNAVLPDASSERTDVWRFAIDHAMERPLTGFGFMAFWRTRDVFSAEMANFWANLAAHSHEYLDIALTTGLPGLAFTLLLVVVMSSSISTTESTETACCRCCACNCFESALFDRGNPIWFFLLSASFGLHFPARYCVRP